LQRLDRRQDRKRSRTTTDDEGERPKSVLFSNLLTYITRESQRKSPNTKEGPSLPCPSIYGCTIRYPGGRICQPGTTR
jgi:hypothetical protein